MIFKNKKYFVRFKRRRNFSLVTRAKMRRHFILILADNEDFRELNRIEDIKNALDANSSFSAKKVFLTSHKESFGVKGKRKFYLTPFVTRSQLNNFEKDDKLVILPASSDLFHILSEEKMNLLPSNEDLIFLNQEELEIDTIFLNLPDKSSTSLLPNCPVCIKRLDKSISGIDPIKCRNIFHSCCQENCKKISGDCAVCGILFDSSEKEINCTNCGSLENLWICLICGNLGCGRYKGGHAHNHFTMTGHTFALKLDSHHIWDYTLDKYVHWSIKSDEGTVVDVDDGNYKTSIESSDQIITASNPQNDFTTAQLESQKVYFEERLQTVKKEHRTEITNLKQLQEEELKNFYGELTKLKHERKIYYDLSGQLQEHIKKLKITTANLSAELETEKKISQGLSETVDNLKKDLTLVSRENEDLREQVKDLMKHLEVLDLMGQAGNIPDIVEGKLLIRPVTSKKKTTMPSSSQ